MTGLEPVIETLGASVVQESGSPDHVVLAPLLVALLTAIACLLTRYNPSVQKGISVLGSVGYAGAVYLVVDAVFLPLGEPTQTLTYQVSRWDAPFGISAVADPLSAFMLGIAALVGVPALVFSIQYVDEFGQRLSYHPLYHFMFVGVSGAFLTGDIFNLFVWFEVMLMSSYVLVVFYSGPEHTRAALQYVVLNLVGSGIMLIAIGGLYSTTGTLNMADMTRRLMEPTNYYGSPEAAAGAMAVILGLSAILFAVFALKAGIVPFQFWVPGAYRAAPAPVAAVLAGVVKKVGIYAIVRLYFTVFAAAEVSVNLPLISGDSVLAFYGPVLFVMAAASILLGGISAIDRDNFDELLSYSSIGQVGFIVLPLAVAATVVGGTADAEALVVDGPFGTISELAITATLVYALNHALAKGALFLASGVVWEGADSIDFRDLGGITEKSPVFAGSVFVAGIALVGIPPVVGFFGKFLVFDTAVRAVWLPDVAGSAIGVGALAVSLGGAVLTIMYFSRAWNRGFWGEPAEGFESPPVGMVGIVVVMALLLLVVGIAFDPVVEMAHEAAMAALDRQNYIQEVAPQNYDGPGTGSYGMDGGDHRLRDVVEAHREVIRP